MSGSRSVLSRTVGFHIARAAVVAYGAFETHIGAVHGLRKVDFSLLMLLWEHGTLVPKQLAKQLALTPPKLSMVLERLQARGWIARAPDEADRRSVRVSLTPAGQCLAAELEPVAHQMEKELRARLTAAEHATLIRLLRKLADADEVTG